MKPVRKKMPVQIVPFVTVSTNACWIPPSVSSTAPIRIMPRFSIRSPTLAHTTIVRTMTSVLIRSLCSLDMYCGLVVSGSGGGLRHGNHRLFQFAAAFSRPLPALRAQFEEGSRFLIEALALVAVPQRFAHDAPDDPRPEIIFVVEAVHAQIG